MAIDFNEYNDEIEILTLNKNICINNIERLEFEMLFTSVLVEEQGSKDEILQFKVKVNDRYFINEEMIKVLNMAINHLKTEKTIDTIYNGYLDRYEVLARRFIKISENADFVNLSNKYFPKIEENNVNL